MEFLLNNYVLIIVLAVVIIMMVVGYFADKKEKQGKEPKLKDKVDEVKNDEEDVQIDEWEDKPVVKDEDIVETEVKDSFDSWEENMDPKEENEEKEVEKEKNDEELDVTDSVIPEDNEGTINDEWTQNFDDSFDKVNAEKEEVVDESKDDKSSEIKEIENSEIEEPVLQNDSWNTEDDDNTVDNMEITLPNIETLDNEIKDVIDNDDVWKF